MYDVVIVGARCAGASVATLLARRGHRVALIDRAEFPSDTISSHFLWPQGAARLASWGLLDRLKSRGCDPIPTLTFDFGSVAFTGPVPSVLGVNEAFCPRRTVLDSIVVEAAVEAGVELFEGTSVRSVRWSEGTACGVDIKPVAGSDTHLEARLVVGADGRHSSIAAQVGAEQYAAEPPLTFAYYSYWSGVPTPSPTYHMRAGRLILRWPTNDGLTCVYVGGHHSEFAAFRRDVGGNFMRSLGDGARSASAVQRICRTTTGRLSETDGHLRATQGTTRIRRQASACRTHSSRRSYWRRPRTLRWLESGRGKKRCATTSGAAMRRRRTAFV